MSRRRRRRRRFKDDLLIFPKLLSALLLLLLLLFLLSFRGGFYFFMDDFLGARAHSERRPKRDNFSVRYAFSTDTRTRMRRTSGNIRKTLSPFPHEFNFTLRVRRLFTGFLRVLVSGLTARPENSPGCRPRRNPRRLFVRVKQRGRL